MYGGGYSGDPKPGEKAIGPLGSSVELEQVGATRVHAK